jgi:RNA polymerase sigma factor (sigma-70 family)
MTDAPDAKLLEQFARDNSEAAFTMLVERHVALVYSVALRHTASPQHAQDITQAVFIILARKTATLNRKTILPGWLYHTARLTAANFQRAETSRVRREQEVFMQSSLQESTPNTLWPEMSPLLDEAMSHLGAHDRDALVLRYFQNKSLSEVGAAMGLEERTAQKRVTRAIEKLRKFFAQHGVTLTATAIAGAVSANSIQAAPAGLAAIISATAISGTTITTAAVIAATKAIAMTTLQKALVTTALVATVGTGIFEAHQNSQLRRQNQTIQQQQAALAGQLAQLQREREDQTNQLSSLLAENEQLKSHSNEGELLKLRGEVTRLRQANAESSAADSREALMKSWLAREDQLKKFVQQYPNKSIPEFQLLSEQQWLDTAMNAKFDTDKDVQQELANLRHAAENNFASQAQSALSKYMNANNGQFPTDLSQLQQYFSSPVDDAILQRWEIAPANVNPSVGVGDTIITEKASVDETLDQRWAIGANGFGSGNWESPDMSAALATIKTVMKAYAAANNGSEPTDPSQVLPYLTTPEQQAAYQTLLKNFPTNNAR